MLETEPRSDFPFSWLRFIDGRMKLSSVATALCLIIAASPTTAQLALPGAVAPNPVGAVEKAPGAHKTTQKTAPTYAPPGAATLMGRPLLLNGANGLLQFSGRADAPRIDRLTLVGEAISDSSRQCRIDVGGGSGVEVKSLGRPDGLLRFAVNVPACPFEFDVLDGAVLVPPQLAACVFNQADCQASPAGLWGPAGTSLGTEAKTIERARALAEAAMTVNYRAFDARLQDRTKADDLARDQARFSQDRAETCRDYLHEGAHGFCASRLTEARAAFLKARLDELPPAVAAKSPGSRAHKRKPPQ
jgi:hypothetical protein